MASSTGVAWPAALEIDGGSMSSSLLLILYDGSPKQNLQNVCFLDLHESRDAKDISEKLNLLPRVLVWMVETLFSNKGIYMTRHDANSF